MRDVAAIRVAYSWAFRALAHELARYNDHDAGLILALATEYVGAGQLIPQEYNKWRMVTDRFATVYQDLGLKAWEWRKHFFSQ